MTQPRDYDNPWKDALERFFERFLAFCFPAIHADLDWSHFPEALEQEQRKLSPEAPAGKRLVDRLMRLHKKSGDIRYLHLEVQGQREAEFPRRVRDYNARATDYLGEEVISAAVLVDADARWRPDRYEYEEWGCRKALVYPVVKVLDWRDREAELAAHPNTFALFMLSHLLGQRTEGDDAAREEEKLRLLFLMAERKLDETEAREWYRLYDWLLPLPREADARVYAEVRRRGQEVRMPFVPYFEREATERGLEKGLQQGLQKGQVAGREETLSVVLGARFGEAGKALAPRLATADAATYEKIVLAIGTASSLDEITKLLP